MTWYITIRSDETYSHSIETPPLLAFLSSIPLIQPSGAMQFSSKGELPSVLVVLEKCSSSGSYASNGEYIPNVNVVELICWSYDNSEWYEHLASQIAMFLDWEAWEDERLIFAKSDR